MHVMFLFHIGAIKRPNINYVRFGLYGFYSTLVRLKVFNLHYSNEDYYMFLFHIGAIKSILQGTTDYTHGRFYSTLVRLKVSDSDPDMLQSGMFLFHIGAIKSTLARKLLMACPMFLFHIGAIKRLSKNYINIIINPYSSCQVKIYFCQIYGWLPSTSNRANSLGG